MHLLKTLAYFGICGASLVPFTAQGQEKAKFRIGHHVLTHSTSSIEVKPNGGGSAKWTETELDTFMGGWEFYVAKAPFNIYLYPGQKNSTVISGYSLTPEIEAGLTLKLRQTSRDKAVGTSQPKSEATTSLMGLYGTYYWTVGTGSVVEFTLNPVFGSETGTDTDQNGVKTKTNTALTEINLSILYDRDLTENLHYYFSIVYTSRAEDDKEAKVKTDVATTAITPIGLRYYL